MRAFCGIRGRRCIAVACWRQGSVLSARLLGAGADLHPAGSRPGGRVTFFCWPRRKSPKKRASSQKPLSSFFSLRTPGPAGDLTPRGPSHHLLARTLRLAPHRREGRWGCSARWLDDFDAPQAHNAAVRPLHRCTADPLNDDASAAYRVCIRTPQPSGAKGEAKRARNVRAGCCVDLPRVVRSPAGPGVRSAPSELRGFALGPSSLVTFFWASRRKLPGCRAGTRQWWR